MEEALYRVVHICVKSQAPWVKLPDQASERLDYTFEWALSNHAKLVDNFSHESDVTSLQYPFTSPPYKTPSYFIIVFRVKYEEASSINRLILKVGFG